MIFCLDSFIIPFYSLETLYRVSFDHLWPRELISSRVRSRLNCRTTEGRTKETDTLVLDVSYPKPGVKHSEELQEK